MSIVSKIFRALPLFKGKFRLASLLLKKSLNKGTPVSFNGKYKLKYNIPNTIEHVGRELFINGVYEDETIKLIKKILNNGGIFFDVGANIGSISVPIAKLTTAQIHAFEPSVFVFGYLKKNIANNNIKSIETNNLAVHSIHNSTLDFYASDLKYGKSSMVPTYSQTSYLVKTISIDEYCFEKKIDKIDVLKIDVQGFEINVLLGCKEMLKKKVISNIIFEFEDWAETDAGFLPGSSQDLLIENGYEIFTLKNKLLKNKLENGTHMLWARPKN